MQRSDEELVRAELIGAVRDVRPTVGFEDGALARGRGLRRRRRTIRVLGTAAAAGLVATGAALWPWQGAGDAPVTGRPPEVRPSTDLGSWLAGLAQGDSTTIPFVASDGVVAGDERVPLPQDVTDADVVGTAAAGRVLLIEREATTTGMWSEYVLLTPSGTFEPLPDQAYQLQNGAVSPDGRLLAYGSAIVDIETGGVVRPVPADAVLLNGWTDAGLVYTDGPGASWLLPDSGAAPVRLDVTVTSTASRSDRAITLPDDESCAAVVAIAADGTAAPLLEGCGPDQPMSLSPDGARVVTADLAIVDVATHDAVHVAPPAAVDSVRAGAVGWEGDGVLLPVIAGERLTVVRCQPSGACERAGDDRVLSPGDQIDLSPPAP